MGMGSMYYCDAAKGRLLFAASRILDCSSVHFRSNNHIYITMPLQQSIHLWKIINMPCSDFASGFSFFLPTSYSLHDLLSISHHRPISHTRVFVDCLVRATGAWNTTCATFFLFMIVAVRIAPIISMRIHC
jgi:hypothetical protein